MVFAALRSRLTGLQAKLDFETWSPSEYPQFASKMSIGRVALLGSLLGFLLGFHLILWIQLSLHIFGSSSPFSPTVAAFLGQARLRMLWQWCAYAVALTTFHLLEFFVTAFYNPTQTTADSFLINHSTAYTAAALTSWTEFVIRFLFSPKLLLGSNHPVLSYIPCMGLFLVVAAQTIRSLAMATAGESFNHLIQNTKKENHVLITHGIYSIFRHPSYVGFFYWSVGTQLLLGNPLHTVGYALASWRFFRVRIAYEEESLCHFFPGAYPAYVARTYTGIPFLKSHVRAVAAATATTTAAKGNSTNGEPRKKEK